MKTARALAALGLFLLVLGQGACKLNDQCLECEKGDAKKADAPTDSPADSNIDGSTCIPTGPEICDGKDNDCDGLIDEGVLPGVGVLCANQMGVCAGGITQCTNGAIVCNKNPSPEICDGLDNNCNGFIDEGDPGGGGRCGNGTGDCVQGVLHCQGPCVGQADGCVGVDSPMCTGGIGPVAEVCDGTDNDCDGSIDEGLTNMGACGGKTCVAGTNAGNVCSVNTDCPGSTCGGPFGLCKAGMLSCIGGHSICQGAVEPVLEKCNGLDDDCDGNVDEDFNLQTDVNNCGTCGHVCGAALTPPGGNAVWACQAGACVIASCAAGYHDNNGMASDGCEFGQCFTSGAEVCDGVDNDCDGIIDETPGIGAAPAICAQLGECAGTVASCPCANTADTGCTGGGSCVSSCAMPTGWSCNYKAMNSGQGRAISLDANGNIIAETTCDLKDNDCNGIVDDNQAQLAHSDKYNCSITTTQSCTSLADTSCPAGETCVYAPFTPPACNNGKLGVCEAFGNYQCNGANLTGPAICNAPAGASPGTEVCNNLDDDCDGSVDEGSSTGSLPGQNWISIGGGHQMMQYEASRPDASSTAGGAVSTTSCKSVAITATSETGSAGTYTTGAAHGFTVGQVVTIAGVGVAGYNGTFQITAVGSTTTFTVTLKSTGLGASSGGTASQNCVATCSQAGVLPWTNVTYLQALAACNAVGATLCSESAWHRACSAVAPSTYPLSLTNSTTTGVLVEAEDYYGLSFADDGTGTTHAWVEDETPGFFGISDLQASPTTGATVSSTNAPQHSPRLDYQMNLTGTGTNFHVCVHMFAPNATQNTIWVGINSSLPGTASTTSLAPTSAGNWQWVQSAAFNLAATGTQYVSLYMSSPGVKVDAVYVVNNTCGTPTDGNGKGGQWAFASAPNTYVTTTCNGLDNGVNALVTAGSLASCYAADSGFTGNAADHAFDMSGNAKEWTLAHQPGQNPIRGGSYNNDGPGIDCPLDFTLADDTFFFPDTGFRCCR